MNQPHKQFARTPYYEALQSDRYARQEAISEIECDTGRQLIVYEANIFSERSSIWQEDIAPFADLLYRVNREKPLDLMLHSSGGDVHSADKIVSMCRELVTDFRVIVPQYAKSAATLIAIASDEILMGLASELGPLDTQIMSTGPGGTPFWTSAQSFIDEFDSIKEEVDKTKQLSPIYYPALDGVNLGYIRMCRNLMDSSRALAEKWLSKHMLKDKPNVAKDLASSLCDAKKWLSHGSVINAEEASRLGIRVSKLEIEDALWQKIWYLHCCYEVIFRSKPVTKVYESSTVSLVFQ